MSEADESKLDTQRIQRALDGCERGKAVVLRAHGASDAFVSGALQLRRGVTLVVDNGATLFMSINPALFENAPGSCGIVNTTGGPGCKPFIAVDGVAGAGIMGDGVIDGRGGIKLLGRSMSAWQTGQNSNPGSKKLSRMVVANDADDFTMYRITLRNSPNFNVSYNGGNGFTVWGVKIDTPRRDGKAKDPLSRNTDGIDPGNGARNITITRSFIRTGDDNIAIKGGPGGVSNMTVSHNHFYWGHGMSIGSQKMGGVDKVLVTDLTLDGTESGLRIKSAGDRGGLVQNITYQDVCIRNSERPIDISASYKANNAAAGSAAPIYRDITMRDVRVAGGGQILIEGFDSSHPANVLLDGVFTTDSAEYSYDVKHANIVVGPLGTNLKVTQAASAARAPSSAASKIGASCVERFVAFPEVH